VIDEISILELFTKLRDAWNSGDAESYGSYFTDNCVYITYDGQHLTGKTENVEFHNKLFKTFLKVSKLSEQIKGIRFLINDIVIVHHTGTIQLRFQKNVPRWRTSINNNVPVRKNGQWKISAFHNCRIRKPGIILRVFKYFSKRND